MKKLLIASTALVATTSVAAADITFDGLGRFSLFYLENDGTDNVDETRLDTRFRLNITGTTETDGGVEFRARIRIEANDNDSGQVGGGGAALEAPEFSVQAGGLRLDVGSTADTLDSGDIIDWYGAAPLLTAAIELGAQTRLPASGFGTAAPDDPTVKVRYAIGDFTVAASYQHNANDGSREEWMLGARYQVSDALGIGAVVGNENGTVTETEAGTPLGAAATGTVATTITTTTDRDADFWALGADGSVGAFGYSAIVFDTDRADDVGYGLGVTYDISSATQLRAMATDTGVDTQDTIYTVGFRHSLGGGVTLGGGFGRTQNDEDIADLGVQFNF